MPSVSLIGLIKKFRWFLTLSSQNSAIWLIFECARAKTARKPWDLLHRSCWVTPQIHTWRTSPRMEVRQIQWYILTFDRRLHSRGKVQIFCEGQCTLGVNIADSDIRKNHLTWNFGSGIKFWFCAFFSALIRGVYLCLIFEMSICEFITNSKKKSISNQTWFFFRVRTWFLLPV